MKKEIYDRAEEIWHWILPKFYYFKEDLKYYEETLEINVFGKRLYELCKDYPSFHKDFIALLDKYIEKFKKEFDEL